jgi:DNA-binding NarL/FixJ family response regulator
MGLTVLIVDDHEEFRRFVRTLVDAVPFEVTGEAGDGESALEAAASLQPDVVLLDVQLPGIDGIEVARRLAERPDPPQVVLMSTRDAEDYGQRLTDSPARGFIQKDDISPDALAELLTPVG